MQISETFFLLLSTKTKKICHRIISKKLFFFVFLRFFHVFFTVSWIVQKHIGRWKPTGTQNDGDNLSFVHVLSNLSAIEFYDLQRPKTEAVFLSKMTENDVYSRLDLDIISAKFFGIFELKAWKEWKDMMTINARSLQEAPIGRGASWGLPGGFLGASWGLLGGFLGAF